MILSSELRHCDPNDFDKQPNGRRIGVESKSKRSCNHRLNAKENTERTYRVGSRCSTAVQGRSCWSQIGHLSDRRVSFVGNCAAVDTTGRLWRSASLVAHRTIPFHNASHWRYNLHCDNRNKSISRLSTGTTTSHNNSSSNISNSISINSSGSGGVSGLPPPPPTTTTTTLILINLINSFYSQQVQRQRTQKEEKKYKKTGHTLMHLQSMTLKMFVNSINNRQATITCITKT